MPLGRRAAAATALLVVLATGWTLAVPARSVAAAPSRVVTADDAAAAPGEVATETTALLADFDGAGRSDLFWYGPGAEDDHLWLGHADRSFGGVPEAVNGSYRPLVGDFSGNGVADILWYGPGAAPDPIWFGMAGAAFAKRTTSVNGTYQPFGGDFDGDGRADIFWYAPGGDADSVWYGRPGGAFVHLEVTVTRTYQPLVGDYNGDGARDILWYGPGAAPDALWLGRPGGGFRSLAMSVGGTYEPIGGDFNGDRFRDILWYQPGAGTDFLWFGHADARFTSHTVAVGGDYQPFTGDFDGDGRRDIFWYQPGSGGDFVWYGGAGGGFTSVPQTVGRTYRPAVADFDGDGAADVLWWAPGPAGDTIWYGRAARGFDGRATTLDLAYDRAVPLRQATIAEQYDPYGFVAHAFGGIDGLAYTNSVEAFERNYGRGFRVFECDNVVLGDGTVLIAHDHAEPNYGLSIPFRQATWADIVAAGAKFRDKYTVMRSQDVLHLLIDHPDIFVITDPKWGREDVMRTYVRQAAALGRSDVLERLMPHVVDQANLDTLRKWYPLRNYVVALYPTQAKGLFDDPEVVDFVRRNRSPAVMMWWKDRDPSLTLAENGQESRRYRASFATSLKAAGANVYVHSLADPVEVQRFWDLGIGVYSDEPFPPLGTTAATLETPVLTTGDDATPPA